MADQVFKNPGAQAEALVNVPPFNREVMVKHFQNYGDGFTDDAYEEWAKKKGKALKGKPLNPEFLKTDFARQWYGDRTETFKDQYINDDEWLEESWPYYADEIYGDANVYFDIDGDYERSFGPVDSYDKYQSYLKWKEEGN